MASPRRWLALVTPLAVASLITPACATGTGLTGAGGGLSETATGANVGGNRSSASGQPTTSVGGSGGPCSLDHVVISEVRSRGAAGANDEFAELYNATGAAVALDATWKIEGRKPGSATYTTRWTGSAGQSIPQHGHFLIASSTGYSGSPTADDKLSSSFTDSSSLRLVHGGATVDALCYYATNAMPDAFDSSFTCEGTPVSNAPHSDGAGTTSDVDASVARRPCADTGDNAADFVATAPATPESTASALTP